MTTPHYRRCHDCGEIALHADNIAPEVCCKRCRSQDTRKMKNDPPLWGLASGAYVPVAVAKCPECGNELVAQCLQTDGAGRPVATGIELDCLSAIREGAFEVNHTWTQDKWQPVRDAVAKWCDARRDF